MSEPFIGMVTSIAFDFAPRGFAFCHGSILPIRQNVALFGLIGVAFGGDGTTNFQLPDLRGRAIIDAGIAEGLTTRTVGSTTGIEQVNLTLAQIPTHTHLAGASAKTADQSFPPDNFWGSGTINQYALAATPKDKIVQLADSTLTPFGDGQAHDNMQPFLAINYVIALTGLWPPRPL